MQISSKVVQSTPTPTSSKYPYIGRDGGSNLTMLMTSPKCGVVIGEGQGMWKIGDYKTEVYEDSLPPLSGSVTLTQ